MDNKIAFTRQGDYYLPNLKYPEQKSREIGVWGEYRKRYLEKHHRILYFDLLTKCKLNEHLADVNEDAVEMYDRLVKQFAKQEGITEQLKSEDQMLWTQHMNSIYSRAKEIVFQELIHV